MILVTGAAGNIGGELVAALAEAGQPVRALTRSADPGRFPPGVEVAGGDLNDPASGCCNCEPGTWYAPRSATCGPR